MNLKKCLKVENNIVEILKAIGENPEREGLQGTPDRIAQMFNEIFRGYDESQKPKITTFQNGSDGITYDSMVVDEGDFYSMCEHHMMPSFGRYRVHLKSESNKEPPDFQYKT